MTTLDQSPVQLRRNALANIAGRIGSVVVWFVITPYALRYLGQERFGIWSLFFLLSGSVVTMDFGMWAGVSRFVAMAAARGERRAVSATIVRGLSLAMALGLIWALACVLGRDLFISAFHVPAGVAAEVRTALLWFALALLLLSGSLVFQGALTGLQRLDLWNVFFMAGLIANTSVMMIGLRSGLGLVATALAAVTGHVVAIVLSVVALRSSLARTGRAGEGEAVAWREMLGYGIVVQSANGLGMLQMQSGKAILGLLGRLAGVTQFELGSRVALALWSLPSLAQMSVIPAVAHASETGGAPAVREVYDWCCRWVFASAAWSLGGLWLLAPPLFRLWLGAGHEEAVAIARWLAVAFMIATLAGPATAVARGHGWPELEAIGFGIALVIGVPLAFAAIRAMGAPGAAFAMAVSFVGSTITLLTIFHRRLEVAGGDWLKRWVLPRYVPAALLVGALHLLTARATWDSRMAASLAIVLLGGLFTALYAAVTWRTGDPAAVWLHARAWVGRFTRPRGALTDPRR